jgi:hypothetical protein
MTFLFQQKLNLHVKVIHETVTDKIPKQKKEPTSLRPSILKMLSGGKSLEIKRTGPVKGSKPKSQTVQSSSEEVEFEDTDVKNEISHTAYEIKEDSSADCQSESSQEMLCEEPAAFSL